MSRHAPRRVPFVKPITIVACPRGRGEPATFRRPARLVIRATGPGHDLWGREVHIIILSTSSLSHCPRCLKRVRSLHAGRVSPIPSLAGRPRRRGPYSTIAICISQGSLTCEVALASSHKASQSPLTLMQGRIPQLHCRSLDMHPEPRINLRSQHNVGASEHFTWPNGRHHEGEHRPRGPS